MKAAYFSWRCASVSLACVSTLNASAFLFSQLGGEAESRKENPRSQGPSIYTKMVWTIKWNCPYGLGWLRDVPLQWKIYRIPGRPLWFRPCWRGQLRLDRVQSVAVRRFVCSMRDIYAQFIQFNNEIFELLSPIINVSLDFAYRRYLWEFVKMGVSWKITLKNNHTFPQFSQ